MTTTTSKDRVAYMAAWRAANAERIKDYNAAWRAANPWKAKASSAAWRAANPEKQAAYSAVWRAANPEKFKASITAYRAANAGKVRASAAARRLNRYQTDPNFRLRLIIRAHLQRIVKSGGVKDAASISYVGCTAAELRRHLEKQFAPGMTWQNHGEWHIDHIIPLAAFDFAAFPAQIKQAEHYTNLRPMWARDNINKGDAILRPVQLDLIAV